MNEAQLPRVKLIPITSTWTCPNCERQNIHRQGLVSDPQNKCSTCGAEVVLREVRHPSAEDKPVSGVDPDVDGIRRDHEYMKQQGIEGLPHAVQRLFGEVGTMLSVYDRLRKIIKTYQSCLDENRELLAGAQGLNIINEELLAKQASEMPLCPGHNRVDQSGALVLHYGNDCVACSLNERIEFLDLLATQVSGSAAPVDSVGFLRALLAKLPAPVAADNEAP